MLGGKRVDGVSLASGLELGRLADLVTSGRHIPFGFQSEQCVMRPILYMNRNAVTRDEKRHSGTRFSLISRCLLFLQLDGGSLTAVVVHLVR